MLTSLAHTCTNTHSHTCTRSLMMSFKFIIFNFFFPVYVLLAGCALWRKGINEEDNCLLKTKKKLTTTQFWYCYNYLSYILLTYLILYRDWFYYKKCYLKLHIIYFIFLIHSQFRYAIEWFNIGTHKILRHIVDRIKMNPYFDALAFWIVNLPLRDQLIDYEVSWTEWFVLYDKV